jgi:hypothetical protein
MILDFGGPEQEQVTGAGAGDRRQFAGGRETPSTYNLQPTPFRSRRTVLLVEDGGGRKGFVE